MRVILFGILASVLVACDGSDIIGPAPAALIAAFAGASQSAPAQTTVTTQPSAKVTDAAGNGVPGVAVTFAVTQGGGVIFMTREP